MKRPRNRPRPVSFKFMLRCSTSWMAMQAAIAANYAAKLKK